MMVTTYINYFKDLAIRHQDIQHGRLEEKKFIIWGADEAITGLKSSVGYPALFLEMFDINTSGNNVYDVKELYKGAISVFDRVLVNVIEDQQIKSQQCFETLNDILRQIWQDHNANEKTACNAPFSFFDFNNLEIVYVGPLFDNIFGWRCEFSFRPKNTLNLKTPPPQGTFN